MQASGLEGREEMPLLLDHPVDHPDDPTGPVSIRLIDEASDVSRPDPSGANQIDAEHQATDLAVASDVPQFGILSDGRCGSAHRWPAQEGGWQASTTVQELIRSLGSRPTRRATMVVHLAIHRPHPQPIGFSPWRSRSPAGCRWPTLRIR
jgi:hypothetical protein